MNPARWQQVADLFHAALERDPSLRSAFLHEAAGADAELLHDVQTLLASHRKAGPFLDEPAWGVAADLILGDTTGSLAGRNIGTYQITEEIGRGGMGVVYAAEDARLGRTVAIKALTPEFTRDPVRRARLTREARAAAALSHPAIATIFALEEIDGELYIVSELVRGRTLREELADGPVPPARLLASLIDIASALSAAHEHGIVHRDLKPENIMRRTDGQIKILDFGLAHSDGAPRDGTTTRLTEAGAALGTLGYMAPEQLSGGQIDARADVFAFGVLAWELATAEHPFGNDPASVLARMMAMMEGHSRAVSRVLPLAGLDRIARRCMRGAPDDRYPSSAALLADLRALEGARPASVPAPHHDALWWWQFHQVAAATLNGLMPVVAWALRRWMHPFGSAMFLAALTLASISVTLRLNLWFTSRVHPEMLADHRARLFPAILCADATLALVFVAGGTFMAGQHDEVAALLLSVGVVTLASLALIEPATTRGAGLAQR